MKQPKNPRGVEAQTDDLLAMTVRLGFIAGLVCSLLTAGSVATATLAQQGLVAADLDAFEKVDLDTLDKKYRDFYDSVEVILTPD